MTSNEAFHSSTILITGGASGIGKELARQLGEYGARIIIADANKVTGAATTAELIAEGRDVIFIHTDLVDQSAAKKLFSSVVKDYGQIEYVINSAGIFMGGEIRDTPLEKWHEVLNNNIFANFNATHYAYQMMLAQGSGHIVNIASAAGLSPIPAMGIYGSSKFAIVGLTLALRNEAKELGIKASVVCPTIVDTPLYDTAIYNSIDKDKLLKARKSLQQPDKTARQIIKGIVKNRATIHTAFSTKAMWTVYRLAPWLYDLGAVRFMRTYRQKVRKG